MYCKLQGIIESCTEVVQIDGLIIIEQIFFHVSIMFFFSTAILVSTDTKGLPHHKYGLYDRSYDQYKLNAIILSATLVFHK